MCVGSHFIWIVPYRWSTDVHTISKLYVHVIRSISGEPKSRLRRGDWDEVNKVFIETPGED